jgi:hypothetical protein
MILTYSLDPFSEVRPTIANYRRPPSAGTVLELGSQRRAPRNAGFVDLLSPEPSGSRDDDSGFQ